MALGAVGGRFHIIDLFAGAGGLSEGFASLLDESGEPVFNIALSVEKENSAIETLRLRSFYRQFGGHPPQEYYAYLANQTDKEKLIKRFPSHWVAAGNEVLQLELGNEEDRAKIDQYIDTLRNIVSAQGDSSILIGGPPCQAYSLVGRARNRADGYVAAKDRRLFLYREFVRILQRLQPAAFVMENVKGILSAKVNGKLIFDRVLEELRNAGCKPNGYRLVPLVIGGTRPHSEYVVRAEQYGIPQKRHRVIILGIRTDVAEGLPPEKLVGASLKTVNSQTTVADALGDLPPLRGALHKSADGGPVWVAAVIEAFRTAAHACWSEDPLLVPVASRLDALAELHTEQISIPARSRIRFDADRNLYLLDWFTRDYNRCLPHHETRGHMKGNLTRFAFATIFAEQFGRSPKAKDFPQSMAPNHANWNSGKFADRFRVQTWNQPSTTITSHIAKDGNYYIHPDPLQCRSLTVREAARLQTFPDDYYFEGNRTQQYMQVGNAVPPLLARQIAVVVRNLLS